MIEKTVKIKSETGLHARPASLFVEQAAEYESEIKVISEDSEVNAKSIMGLLSLGVEQGTEITIQADGVDAQEAVSNLEELVKNNFGK